MKSILTTGLLAMACLTAYSHASAQTTVEAKIPFEFTVGQNVLPPGTYSISQVTPSIIELANLETTARALVATFPMDYVSRQPRVLIFRKYGDRLYLGEVRGSLGELSLDIPQSKLEKESQRREAAAHAHRQTTEVAFK